MATLIPRAEEANFYNKFYNLIVALLDLHSDAEYLGCLNEHKMNSSNDR